MYVFPYYIMKTTINGIEWKIVLTTNTENLKRSDGSITLGVTDLNVLTIFLWKGLKDDMFRKVLIHELSHAFIFSYDYYLTLEEEEFLCSFIDTYAEDIIHEADSLIFKGVKEIRKFS